MTKILCLDQNCGWKGTETKVVKAPNPYNEEEIFWICPQCKDEDSLQFACDVSECWRRYYVILLDGEGFKNYCKLHRHKT